MADDGVAGTRFSSLSLFEESVNEHPDISFYLSPSSNSDCVLDTELIDRLFLPEEDPLSVRRHVSSPRRKGTLSSASPDCSVTTREVPKTSLSDGLLPSEDHHASQSKGTASCFRSNKRVLASSSVRAAPPLPKRARTRYPTDRERAIVMTYLTDLIEVARDRQRASRRVLSNTADTTSCVDPLPERGTGTVLVREALDVLADTAHKLATERQVSKERLVASVLPYIIRARCRAGLERGIVEALLQSGDLLPAYNHVETFTRILLSPSSEGLPKLFLEPLVSLVSRTLKPYCAGPTAQSTQEDDTLLNVTACPKCGFRIALWDIPSGTCEACGAVTAGADPFSHAFDVVPDDLFQTGRQFVADFGAFQHLSVTDQGRQRIKATILTSVRTVCRALGITSESRIIDVAHTVAQYARTGRTARLQGTIAACCFLVLRRDGEPATIGQLAASLNLHASTLAALVKRISVVLGFRELPPVTPTELVQDAVRRILRHIAAASATDEQENASPDSVSVVHDEITKRSIITEHHGTGLNSLLPLPSGGVVANAQLDTLDLFDTQRDLSGDSQAVFDSGSSNFCDEGSSPAVPNDLLEHLFRSETPPDSTHMDSTLCTLDSLLFQNFHHSTETHLSRPKGRRERGCAEQLVSTEDVDALMVAATVADSAAEKPSRRLRVSCASRPCRSRRRTSLARSSLQTEQRYVTTVEQLLEVCTNAQSAHNANSVSVTWQRLRRLQVECVPVRQLHFIAAAVYYAGRFLRVGVSAGLVSDVLRINKGSFNRVRSEFITTLHQHLVDHGLWNYAESPREKRRCSDPKVLSTRRKLNCKSPSPTHEQCAMIIIASVLLNIAVLTNTGSA